MLLGHHAQQSPTCAKTGETLMSQKLIEFLIHFSDFSYNIIAYFYAEICVIYQIYILHKFNAEMKIPAKIKVKIDQEPR